MTPELQARLIWEAIKDKKPDPCHHPRAGGHAARMFAIWHGNGAVAALSSAKREKLAKEWVAAARAGLIAEGLIALSEVQRICGEPVRAKQLSLL
jgi:hypothetical protein